MMICGRLINVQMSAFILASLLVITAPLPAAAQEVHAFNVSAQDPASAIRAFGAQAEIQILASADDLKGKKFNPISGDISTEDALNSLLSGTGLAHKYVGDRAVALVSNTATAAQSSSGTQIGTGTLRNPNGSVRIAQSNATSAQSGADSSQNTNISSSSSASRDSERNGLEEIVVTATKRETTIQHTPISITAISGADIEARGIVDFTELAQSIPGVSMKTSGPGQTEFEMRGMAGNGGGAATVGFYLDDTPLTGPATSTNGHVVIDPNLYDLNRVEVLRGPQGTLYGSSSMGGTIKIVPSPPNPAAFDASVETIFSDTDGGGFNHGENAMVNLPFGGGTAAVRIVGSQDHESGWIDRIVIANGDFPLETNNLQTRGNVLAAPVAANYKDVNDEDLTSVRVSLLWKPSDQLSVTPSYFYQKIKMGGLSDIDSNPGTNAHYQPFDTPEPFSDRFDLGSLNIKYSFNAFDLTSTTSYWSRDQQNAQDASEEWQWIFSKPTILPFYTSQGGIGPTDPTPIEIDDTHQTSEELRLSSSGDSRFQWLVGYFYSDFFSGTYDAFIMPGALPVFGTANIYTAPYDEKIIQNSVFGEASFQLTPELKATAGLRRYSYNSPLSLSYSGYEATGSNAVASFASNAKDQGLSPKFNLSYEFDKNFMVYATMAKGFRPGSGDFPVPTSGPTSCEASLQALSHTTAFVPSPTSYGPDTVWSYELGEKATLLDRRLTINTAAYFENWSGVQEFVALSCGFGFTGNAGDAHVYGGEFETNFLLTDGLILSANAGYSNATIVSSGVGTGIKPGTRVQDVPDWTSSVSLAYRRSISNQLAFTARVENDYVGTRMDVTYAANYLPSYDLTNIRAGVEGDRWRAVVFAKNVLNQRALLSDTPQLSVYVPTFNRIAVNQPLTIGIDLSYHFGR
jgi:outer membrane receptor protein involved in Fe transport